MNDQNWLFLSIHLNGNKATIAALVLLLSIIALFIYLYRRTNKKNNSYEEEFEETTTPEPSKCGQTRKRRRLNKEAFIFYGSYGLIGYALFVYGLLGPLGALTAIVLIITYKSFIRVQSGKWFILTSPGGTGREVILGRIPGYIINDPRSANHDARYEFWAIIPTVNKDSKISWGAPGYNHPDKEIKTDRDYRDDRTFIEKNFGYVFKLWILYRVAYQNYTERTIIHKDEESQYSEWRKVWTSYDDEYIQVVREVKNVKFRDLLFFDKFVVPGLETGKIIDSKSTENDETENVTEPAETKKSEDVVIETMRIDVMLGIQVLMANPFIIWTKSKELTEEVFSVVQGKMVQFVGDRNYNQLIRGDHSEPDSPFKKAIRLINGDWHKEGDDHTHSRDGGSIHHYGFALTGAAQWEGIKPSDENSELMVKSTQKIYIAKQRRLEQEELGKGDAARYSEQMKARTIDETAYRIAVKDHPLPEEVAKWTGVGDNRGYLVLVDDASKAAASLPTPAMVINPEKGGDDVE